MAAFANQSLVNSARHGMRQSVQESVAEEGIAYTRSVKIIHAGKRSGS